VKAQNAGTWSGAPLAGIAVGNGCSGSEVGVCAQNDEFSYFRWAYLLQTAFVSSSTKSSIASACNWTAASPSPSPSCEAALTQAAQSMSHVNLYNVYGDCISGTLTSSSASASSSASSAPQAAAPCLMQQSAPPARYRRSPPAASQPTQRVQTPASTRGKRALTSTEKTFKVHTLPLHLQLDMLRSPYSSSRHPRSSNRLLLVRLQVTQLAALTTANNPAFARNAAQFPARLDLQTHSP
jgi:hypothetical protein